jgi:hypothetical protein
MSLGKAMIHARKQKSIARAAALAGEHSNGQHAVQTTHMLQMPVLVLNASYEPINICGARRALVLVLKGNCAYGGGAWAYASCAAQPHRHALGDSVA